MSFRLPILSKISYAYGEKFIRIINHIGWEDIKISVIFERWLQIIILKNIRENCGIMWKKERKEGKVVKCTFTMHR